MLIFIQITYYYFIQDYYNKGNIPIIIIDYIILGEPLWHE